MWEAGGEKMRRESIKQSKCGMFRVLETAGGFWIKKWGKIYPACDVACKL